MYGPNEIPKIRGTISYYGHQCPDFTPQKLLDILSKYDFFPANYVCSPVLTKGRFVKYRDQFDRCFQDTFENPEAGYISLLGAESIRSNRLWDISWYPVKPSFFDGNTDYTWNTLFFDATYDHMEDANFCNRFLNCFQELIALLHPFYATIEDIALSVRLNTTRNGRVVPMTYGKVHSIYWGNYFGPDYCKSYDLNPKLAKLMRKKYAPSVINEIADGIYITLTTSPMDYDTDECWKKRTKLMHRMGI